MMADGQDEGTRDLSKQNPFRMPTDEEIFSLRDEERARKEEVPTRSSSCRFDLLLVCCVLIVKHPSCNSCAKLYAYLLEILIFRKEKDF